MKILFLLLASLLVSDTFQIGEASVLRDSGDINFEFIKEKIIVPVKIAGKNYRFLLDTGGILEVSQELQDYFSFVETESTTIVGINRQELEIKSVIVPEVPIGRWSFTNRKAIVSDITEKYPYSCFEVDGMIGRDFFEKVVLHFDLKSSTFRLTENPDVIELDKAHRTRMRLSKRGLPSVKLKINGKREWIEFDSGSGDFYSPKTSDTEKKLEKNPNADILTFEGTYSFGITMDKIQITNRYKEKIKSFKIGNRAFNNFYSQFSKVSAPRIGAAILKYGTITLDYKRGWFYYQPYHDAKEIAPFKTFGFDISIEDGTYTVKYILKGSEAEQLGLRPSDKIIEIDEVPTTNISEDCEGYLYGYTYKIMEKIKLSFITKHKDQKTIEITASYF